MISVKNKCRFYKKINQNYVMKFTSILLITTKTLTYFAQSNRFMMSI